MATQIISYLTDGRLAIGVGAVKPVEVGARPDLLCVNSTSTRMKRSFWMIRNAQGKGQYQIACVGDQIVPLSGWLRSGRRSLAMIVSWSFIIFCTVLCEKGASCIGKKHPLISGCTICIRRPATKLMAF